MENRLAIILKTSVIGIIVNVFLALFKIIIGAVTKSLAITSDGINNFADAASSIITLVGAKLAGKPADRKHPFGYGRMEYLSALVIAVLVLYAGATSFIEAVKAIINPEVAEYTTVTLVIISIAVVVKLALSLYTSSQGKKANSDSLIASGKESILDVVVSISTVVAAIIFILTGLSLEAYLAAVIAIIIVKTGVEALRDTISKILGEPAEVQLVLDVKKTVVSVEGVNGVYDVIFNNYGPELYTASCHIEVSESLTAGEVDFLIREVTELVLKKHGVFLTAVSIYAKNSSESEAGKIESAIRDKVLKIEHIIGMHGFYIDVANKKMLFDLVISLSAKDRLQVYEDAVNLVKKDYQDYAIDVTMDMDMNEAV